MATTRTTNSRSRGSNRTASRFGAIGDSVRERPLATAAVATAAAAAGAFFFARRSGVTADTITKWGQDAKDGLDNLTGRGKADSDNAQQGSATDTKAAATSPSVSAATKLGSGSAPASAKKSAPKGSGNTGLDETDADQSKVGSVAYGA
jgi:hypothetical protein